MPKLLWKIHSYLGLLVSLGLLVVGITGSVLVFKEQVNALLMPSLFKRTDPTLPRQKLDTLRQSVEVQMPGYGLVGWHTRDQHDPYTDELYLIRYGTAEWQTTNLDPGTGRVLSPPRGYRDDPMGWLLEFHYSFLGGAIGLGVCLCLSVILVVLALTGLFLQRKAWRRTGLPWTYDSFRLRLSGLHRWVGMLCSAQFLVLGSTGAVWTTERLQEALRERKVTPEILPGQQYPPALSLDAVVASAPSHLPGFAPRFISLPSSPGYRHVTLWGTAEPRSSLVDAYASTLRFSAQDGAFEAADDVRQTTAWARTKATFKPLHFGQFGGITTRILFCLTGLAPGLLGISGFLIWRHRQQLAVLKMRLAAAP